MASDTMVLVSIGKEVQVTIVVGFVPTAEGRAALDEAIDRVAAAVKAAWSITVRRRD